MRVFICWLINACDWIGGLSFYAWFVILPLWKKVVVFGSIVAIIPAFITAIYAAMNYELMLSRGMIRWMSPLNIVTNRFYYFFKVLFLSGAAWSVIISYCAHKFFPNENFDWLVPFLKNVVERISHLFC